MVCKDELNFIKGDLYTADVNVGPPGVFVWKVTGNSIDFIETHGKYLLYLGTHQHIVFDNNKPGHLFLDGDSVVITNGFGLVRVTHV